MEQPTRRWICFAFDYECTAEKPDDHPLHAECGWWQPLPADRDQGNTNSQHLPVDAELVADHRDRGGCPWIITGDEGTSHCSLAERGSSDLDALVDASITDDMLAQARDGRAADARNHAALRFAQRVAAERGRVQDADIATLRAAGFNDAETVEIVLHVALNVLTNYVNNVAHTDVDFPRVSAHTHA